MTPMNCEQCGGIYQTYRAWVKKSRHHLCGKQCLRAWRSEYNKVIGLKPPGFKPGNIPWNKDLGPEFNSNWKGGVTEAGLLIRASRQYKEWRRQVYERDQYKCVWCGVDGDGRNLNADHIKPFSKYPELRLDINNGRTLCVDCHRKTPTYGRPKQCV